MEVDVIIIGGGPAGSAMGAYLGKAGVSCIVFEKEKFSRICSSEVVRKSLSVF